MKSIHGQSYKNFEHILIDGCSTDDTCSIAAEFENILLVSEEDSGQSDAINKGFALAKGDIIAWQNADDLYCAGAFERVINFFTENTDVDVVYGGYQLIDSNNKWICDVNPIDWDLWLFSHGRFCPLQPTVFWRRNVFDKIGLLDDELHYCMDVDYFSRMANNNFKFKRVSELLGQFRVHSQSKTQNASNYAKVKHEYKKVLAKNFNYDVFDFAFFEFFQLRSRAAKKIKMGLNL
jgi:glycosyltransferase involved in cell wall biosynthesis